MAVDSSPLEDTPAGRAGTLLRVGVDRNLTLLDWRIIISMATYRISEAEAARDLPGLLARVRAGAEFVIELDSRPVAVVHTPRPPGRTIEECVALLPENSPAVMDEDFARDVAAAIDAHREPLNPPSWD